MVIGLRQGEALGLRWQDIDLDRGLLTVARQLQRIDGKLILTEPKTPRSRRTLQLPAVAIEALRAHKLRQLEERLAAGPAWQDSGLVFTTAIGTPLDARNVVRHFHRLLAKAGLPRMPFHNLRHTAASLLLAQGLDIRVVQHVLGHSQISLTANLYASRHTNPTSGRGRADGRGAPLGARIGIRIGIKKPPDRPGASRFAYCRLVSREGLEPPTR